MPPSARPAIRRLIRKLQRAALPVLVLCAMGGGLWWWLGAGKTETTAPDSSVVQIADLEETVTAQGKLEPKDYVDVGTQVSGQLKRLHVELGDSVAAGQLLAEIDPQIYTSRVEADTASLENLQAQLREQEAQVILAKQQDDRNKQLLAGQAVSQDTAETAATAYKAAIAKRDALKAQIRQAKSTLKGDQLNLGYTNIYAPISGTVVAQSAREGQTVNASQSAPTIVQVANLDVMTSRAQVAEADVMRITPGMPVYFTTLGDQAKRWYGRVRQVLPTPQTVNDVVLYNVLVDADNASRQLMTGMSTQMFFIVAQAKQVPVIPVSALGKKTGEGSDITYDVRVKVPGKDAGEVRKVKIGVMTRQQAEVVDGLKVGEEVIIPSRANASGSSSSKSSSSSRSGMMGPPF